MAEYEWRGGSRIGGVKAADAAAELARIRTENGGQLQPTDVVEGSRPEEAPLHPAFEWDDSEAAEQYRLWQARAVIRSIRVVRQDNQPSEPQYVHVKTVDESYYQDSSVAVKNVDEWAAAVHELQANLNSLARSVEDLRRISNKSKRTNVTAIITLAEEALGTVRSAIDKLAA